MKILNWGPSVYLHVAPSFFPPISISCKLIVNQCLSSGSTPRYPIDYREGPGNPKKNYCKTLVDLMHVNRFSSRAKLRWPQCGRGFCGMKAGAQGSSDSSCRSPSSQAKASRRIPLWNPSWQKVPHLGLSLMYVCICLFFFTHQTPDQTMPTKPISLSIFVY